MDPSFPPRKIAEMSNQWKMENSEVNIMASHYKSPRVCIILIESVQVAILQEHYILKMCVKCSKITVRYFNEMLLARYFSPLAFFPLACK